MRNPSINHRVQQLEVEVGLVASEVRGVKASQEAFYTEWKSQQDENRRQKEEDRRLAEANAKNNRITLPQLFTMGAALVAMLVAIGGLNLYMIDNRILGAVTPLSERQMATTEANLSRNEKDGDRDRTLMELTAGAAQHQKDIDSVKEEIRDVESTRSRVASLESELKAEKEIRQLRDDVDKELFETKTDSIAEELRRFKQRVESERVP